MLKDKINLSEEEVQEFAEEIKKVQKHYPKRINVDPEGIEQGLAKLVLTIIELIRKLMEKEAIRRIESGTISEEEIEKIGEAFLKLEEKMEELKDVFALKDEDLNLDLGPLGNLM
ncbi:MAG: gas vesicle protein K [Dethiobacter sp.]|nr:MAG: gas vesicle protein K [Dethiobacter sp.]